MSVSIPIEILSFHRLYPCRLDTAGTKTQSTRGSTRIRKMVCCYSFAEGQKISSSVQERISLRTSRSACTCTRRVFGHSCWIGIKMSRDFS